MPSLPQLPADKANHAVYGAAICCVVSLLFGAGWGMTACIAAALLKELSDLYQNKYGEGGHEVSLADSGATMLGGLMVYLPQVFRILG